MSNENGSRVSKPLKVEKERSSLQVPQSTHEPLTTTISKHMNIVEPRDQKVAMVGVSANKINHKNEKLLLNLIKMLTKERESVGSKSSSPAGTRTMLAPQTNHMFTTT